MIRIPATCMSKGMVYLIECRKCRKQYIGSTKNAMHIRLNGHIYDVKNKKTQKSAVAKHFNQHGHSKEDLTIMVIRKTIFTSEEDGKDSGLTNSGI